MTGLQYRRALACFITLDWQVSLWLPKKGLCYAKILSADKSSRFVRQSYRLAERVILVVHKTIFVKSHNSPKHADARCDILFVPRCAGSGRSARSPICRV